MRGTSLKSLMAISDEMSLVPRAVKLPLEEIAHLQMPAILHSNFNHYVVIERVRRGKALIHNPAGQSRWYGFTLGITVDNTRGGNCGGVVGLNHPGEGFLSGDHMNGVWFGNKEASAAHQAQMPRVPDGKYNGLVVSPLRSARLDPPDICLFYGTPGQMIYFINGLQFHRYRRYDFTCTGESACADSWGPALATRQTSLSLPCYAERRYGGVADDELLMACPPDEFLRAIEGMGHLGKNGLRYPFPPYCAAMDPAFGMAKSYG